MSADLLFKANVKLRVQYKTIHARQHTRMIKAEVTALELFVALNAKHNVENMYNINWFLALLHWFVFLRRTNRLYCFPYPTYRSLWADSELVLWSKLTFRSYLLKSLNNYNICGCSWNIRLYSLNLLSIKKWTKPMVWKRDFEDVCVYHILIEFGVIQIRTNINV